MITIVDYGMGNLRSVQKALEKAGVVAQISQEARAIESADALVVPGVGAFGAAIHQLTELNLMAPIRDYALSNRPFLGICLGLQMLFESSEESPGVKGLGVFQGTVNRFFTEPRTSSSEHINTSTPQHPHRIPNLKVPHMGWNQLTLRRPSSFFEKVPSDATAYFVHSYYVDPLDSALTLTATNYGIEFTSSIQKGNLIATQFHPEKSGAVGLRMLKNFVLANHLSIV